MTLKILKRHPDAPIEPPKYMGCGHCEAFNRSGALWKPTQRAEVIAAVATEMWRSMNFDPCEIRGIGMHMAQLVEAPEEDGQSASAATNGPPAKRPRTMIERMVNVVAPPHASANSSSAADHNVVHNGSAEIRPIDLSSFLKNFVTDVADPTTHVDHTVTDFEMARLRQAVFRACKVFAQDEQTLNVVRELLFQWLEYSAPADAKQSMIAYLEHLSL
jgi:hypothetical protein